MEGYLEVEWVEQRELGLRCCYDREQVARPGAATTTVWRVALVE